MMPSLPELQGDFASALGSDTSGRMSAWIVAGDLDADARIGIYRNNVLTGRARALAADYPVVAALVGGEFFDHMARAYAGAVPSRSGDLGEYGRDFAEFVAAYSPAAGLPYLADVARLERAWAASFLAAEAVPDDFSALARVAPERLALLRFTSHPSLRLLTSPWPLREIWHSHQPDYAGSGCIDLDQGGEPLLLLRVHEAVTIQALPAAEYAWVAVLASGQTLGDAVEAAFAEDGNFDLGETLRRHIVAGTFIHFTEDGT